MPPKKQQQTEKPLDATGLKEGIQPAGKDGLRPGTSGNLSHIPGANPVPDKPIKMSYSLKNLTWDKWHHFNTEGKYSYNGKGRKLGDACLMCDACLQWFHLAHVKFPQERLPFVPFQRNYRFLCRVCAQGPEEFEIQMNTWTSIILTAIYNLMLNPDKTKLITNKWLDVKDIIAWIEAHWGGLCDGRNLQQMTERNAIQKCLGHAQNLNIFDVNKDRTQVMLKKAKDKDLLLRPLVSSIAPRLKKEYQKAIDQQEGGFVDDKTGGKRKRDDVPLKPGRKKINAPTMDQIKLPEKYKLVPVPKGDVVNTQDPSIVQLSKTARAKEIQLKDVGEGDLKVPMIAVGYKGYRMVRATHGTGSGSWYFEVRVDEPLNGEDGHTRIGWSMDSSDVQTPVGYDSHSYSYRDIEGTKFHESIGEAYGESYGPGDVIGCLIQMGETEGKPRSRQRVNLKGAEWFVEEQRERVRSDGSHIEFFKNGVAQGRAFETLWAEEYFPAVALYRAACVQVNFGPTFAFPPPAELGARAMCEKASPRPPEELGGDLEGVMDEAKAAAGDEVGEEGDEGLSALREGGEAMDTA